MGHLWLGYRRCRFAAPIDIAGVEEGSTYDYILHEYKNDGYRQRLAAVLAASACYVLGIGADINVQAI